MTSTYRNSAATRSTNCGNSGSYIGTACKYVATKNNKIIVTTHNVTATAQLLHSLAAAHTRHTYAVQHFTIYI